MGIGDSGFFFFFIVFDFFLFVLDLDFVFILDVELFDDGDEGFVLVKNGIFLLCILLLELLFVFKDEGGVDGFFCFNFLCLFFWCLLIIIFLLLFLGIWFWFFF